MKAKSRKSSHHLVGAAPNVESDVFSLLETQKSIGASPLGSPAVLTKMLDFSARHGIAPRH